jgi:HSP20 family protein
MYYSCSPFTYMRKAHFRPRMVERFHDLAKISFPMEVVEGKESYSIKALLPGFHAEDISIEVKDNHIFIECESKATSEDKRAYLLQEIPYGKFSRSLILPAALNPDKAEASMENGILKIEIQKAEEAKPKTVKINK